MSTKSAFRELLIATVGESSQVVTLALDELLRRGVPIRRVVVIQPTETMPRIKAALDRLRAEVPLYQEKRGIEFEFCFFEDESGYRPADMLDQRDAEVALQTLDHAIKKAKGAGWRVHLLISGGRKIISAFGTVAAQFHFEEDDRCWHLAETQRREWEAMHAAPDEPATLVRVPVPGWKIWKATIATSLALSLTDNPIQTEQMLRHLESSVEAAHKLRDFYFRELNPTEQQVLALLSLKGLRNDELVKQLGFSVKNKLTKILEKYGDFVKTDVDDPRLIADFQQIMIALEFQGKLPALTPAKIEKPAATRKGK